MVDTNGAAVEGPYGHALVNTDAPHFASVRRPASPGQPQTNAEAPQPESVVYKSWKQYEINDGVRIIAERKVSRAGRSSSWLSVLTWLGVQAFNGVMYLIDGTVLV